MEPAASVEVIPRPAVPPRIEPRLSIDTTGVWSVVLPGEPGFEVAGS